jgi:hypothetical protein
VRLYSSYTRQLLGALWRSGQLIQKGFSPTSSTNPKVGIDHFLSCSFYTAQQRLVSI